MEIREYPHSVRVEMRVHFGSRIAGEKDMFAALLDMSDTVYCLPRKNESGYFDVWMRLSKNLTVCPHQNAAQRQKEDKGATASDKWAGDAAKTLSLPISKPPHAKIMPPA